MRYWILITALYWPLSMSASADMPMQESMKSIVNIMVENAQSALEPSDDPSDEAGSPKIGSGVILDDEGLIVTNDHVVRDAERMVVTLHDGRHFMAEVVGQDHDTDLAVIRIQADNLHPIKVQHVPHYDIGDTVIAIGSPFGLNQSVTSGIISGVNRNVGMLPIEDFIQVDAPINPGNSGGALINREGELIGINTAILTTTGANLGIGLAIPTTILDPIFKQLVAHGDALHAKLGVVVQNLNPALVNHFSADTPDIEGVLIAEITTGSAAEAAGLRQGDIITAIDKQTVTSVSQLASRVGVHRTGDKIRIDFQRLNQMQKVTVKLSPHADAHLHSKDFFDGLTLTEYTFQDGELGQISGIAVLNMLDSSQAWLSGMQIGDVITMVDQQPVTSLHELTLARQADTAVHLLRLIRNGHYLYLSAANTM